MTRGVTSKPTSERPEGGETTVGLAITWRYTLVELRVYILCGFVPRCPRRRPRRALIILFTRASIIGHSSMPRSNDPNPCFPHFGVN